MASKVRVKMIEGSYQDRTLLHACHLPFPGLGRVIRTVDGYRWIDSKD
jgi:hypothetical protein